MKSHLKIEPIIVAVLVGFAMFLSVSSAETLPHHKIECHYSITMVGDEVGKASISRTSSQQAESSTLRIEETSQLQFSGFWGDWKLSMASVTEFSRDGIRSFDHKTVDSDEKFHIRGELRNGELWCSVYQVLSAQENNNQKQEALLKGAGQRAASEAIPDLDTEGPGVGMRGGGEEQDEDLRIPLKDFDATIRGLPFYLQRHNYQLRKNEIRLLDTEQLEVERYSIKLLGEERINLGGQIFLCRVVLLISPNSEISYWIAEDKIGPFLVKESNKDDEGTYEILLKEYKEIAE
jgi:hypothetical protein